MNADRHNAHTARSKLYDWALMLPESIFDLSYWQNVISLPFIAKNSLTVPLLHIYVSIKVSIKNHY
jgi:hypothetical protein